MFELRRLACLVLPVSAALCGPVVLGCATGFAPIVDEPVRIGTLDDLGSGALGFHVGVTTLEEAKQAMKERRLTGIVADEFATGSGPTLAVLGADYQRHLHLFNDGRYVGSFLLPTEGLPPYGLALRVARAGDDTVVLVLHRDPLERTDEPPRLLSFRWSDNTNVELLGRASLGTLSARHHGMTHPMLLGDSLTDEGVMLVARDHDGALWDTSYVLRFEPHSLGLVPRSMADALRCSCVRRYAMNLQ